MPDQEWVEDSSGKWGLWKGALLVQEVFPPDFPPNDGIPKYDVHGNLVTIAAFTGGLSGSDAGSPIGDSATGLGAQFPIMGDFSLDELLRALKEWLKSLLNLPEIPWALIALGVAAIVVVSNRRGRR
jgi:hypothetical protein